MAWRRAGNEPSPRNDEALIASLRAGVGLAEFLHDCHDLLAHPAMCRILLVPAMPAEPNVWYRNIDRWAKQAKLQVLVHRGNVGARCDSKGDRLEPGERQRDASMPSTRRATPCVHGKLGAQLRQRAGYVSVRGRALMAVRAKRGAIDLIRNA